MAEIAKNAYGDAGEALVSTDGGLKLWISPELTLLRAGAAESNPGTNIYDGLLEGIGS